MQDHYFTSSPEAPARERRIVVDLAGAPRTVTTSTGIFSPDHVDTGTRVLLDFAPVPVGGRFLDIGCGWGPIALTMGLLRPDAEVWAVDVNGRSLDLTRRNAADLGIGRLHAVPPEEVPPDLAFDTIWSNPPIRIGKDALHALLLTWLPRLAPGGSAWLVVQKNLGADSLLTWLRGNLPQDFTATREHTKKAFRVIKVVRHVEKDFQRINL